MRYWWLAIALCMAAVLARAEVPASFNAAVAAYDAGRHEPARDAFLRMARDGRTDAQFNLAAMMANGQGGTTDLPEATLWMTVASEAGYTGAQAALETLHGALDTNQRDRVDDRLAQWREDYSRSALHARHAPEFCAECERDYIGPDERHRLNELIREGELRLERKQPRYPPEAASNRIIGQVEMGAWLSVDGTLEQPHVLFSDPAGTFDDSAIRALKRWEFNWQVPVEDRSGFYMTQTIEFKLTQLKQNYRLERQLRRDLDNALEHADQNAFPAYIAANTLEFIGLEADPDQPSRLIDIMAMAARQDAVRAQVDLADRLRSGHDVEADRESGLFWLRHAAYHGDARAQFHLSRLESQIGESRARSFGAEAEASGYLPALLAGIRREMLGDCPPEPGRLDQLFESLPDRWLRNNREDELIQQAETLLER